MFKTCKTECQAHNNLWSTSWVPHLCTSLGQRGVEMSLMKSSAKPKPFGEGAQRLSEVCAVDRCTLRLCPKWHPILYVVHYCWPYLWSKVAYHREFGAIWGTSLASHCHAEELVIPRCEPEIGHHMVCDCWNNGCDLLYTWVGVNAISVQSVKELNWNSNVTQTLTNFLVSFLPSTTTSTSCASSLCLHVMA